MPEIFSYEVNVPVEEETEWNVLVSTTESWTEQRRIKSSKPRRYFTVNLRAKPLATSQGIFSFYNRMSGDANTFYWENPNENPIRNEVVGSGDGSATVFYTDNFPIASGSYVVRVQGVQKTEVTHYTISGGTGTLTFKGGSIPSLNNEVQMDYRFYRNVRFDGKPNRSLIGFELADIRCKFVEVL